MLLYCKVHQITYSKLRKLRLCIVYKIVLLLNKRTKGDNCHKCRHNIVFNGGSLSVCCKYPKMYKMQELKLRMTLCHSFMEVKIKRFSVILEFGTLFFLV